MERELVLTGIGGQGVQLAGQVLARAATIEGRQVSMFGIYGGMMRGGNTDCTVVVADVPLQAPPIVSSAWSCLAMHDEFWAPIASKVRDAEFVLANTATFHADVRGPAELVRIDATGAAHALGNAMAASMVMVGAYATLTGLVGRDTIDAAIRASIPKYRTQHVDLNLAAVEAGTTLVDPLAHPAWETEVVA